MVIPGEEEWGPWTGIDNDLCLDARVLHELLTGGQTFQWHRMSADEDVWIGLLNGSLIQLRTGSGRRVLFRAIEKRDRSAIREDLSRWFRVDEAHEDMLASLPFGSDPYLARCVESFPGLRILRQPIEEVLLTFLCSSNKQIVQIRRMLGKLSERWGECHYPGWFGYPSWESLAEARPEELQACGTGYRGKYIQGCARRIDEVGGYFTDLVKMNYREAKNELMQLPGVGPKVADCILLYGGGYYESFPLDTWILKAMKHRYGKEKSTRTEMEAFATEYFGPYAGIAQQYIFAFEREVNELSRRKRII